MTAFEEKQRQEKVQENINDVVQDLVNSICKQNLIHLDHTQSYFEEIQEKAIFDGVLYEIEKVIGRVLSREDWEKHSSSVAENVFQ